MTNINNKKKADFIAWIHFIWILFGFISLPLLFWINWWNYSVLIFGGATILSWIVFRGCWFLQLENKWRKQQNPKEAFEDEAFVQHYLKKLFNITCSKVVVRAMIYTYFAILVLVSILEIF